MAAPEPGAPASDAVAAGALAVAAAGLLLSLFLHWYRLERATLPFVVAPSPDATGWQLFTFTDIVLAATCAGALALATTLLGGGGSGVRTLALAGLAGCAVTGLVVWRALDPPIRVLAGHAQVRPALGAYVALAALASMLLAVVLTALWRI